MSKKKQFKAESKKLLDMMIHSIYTHKEIFLRELISNSSDALDKLNFKSLTDTSLGINKDNLEIFISLDKDNREFVITDNGIGMTKDDLEKNLGTIAKSGSLDFKKDMGDDNKDLDIIGQFGVGFYSAFMVAKKISVVSKSLGSDVAYLWESEGEDGYSLSETTKNEVGTTITLSLRDNNKEENYDEYLKENHISSLVKKYSDFIRYPIKMEINKEVPKKDDKGEIISGEYDSIKTIETLNSRIPLWKREKKEISKEEYQDFYKENFRDFTNPLRVIHNKVEGNVSFTALLYIPSKAPYNFYSPETKQMIKLYSKGVFIMDETENLIPDHFKFVKGLIDTDDISLNISREILQKNKQLKIIRKNIEKKIKNELTKTLESDRENYDKFFEEFGLQLKFGAYNNYGENKDLLVDLLLFKSSKEDKYVTLNEYTSRMAKDQKYIYYGAGESIDIIKALPQMEKVLDKGFEVLYLSDEVDDFLIKILMNYKDFEFKSIAQGDFTLDDKEKDKIKNLEVENDDLLKIIKESLVNKVDDVRLSSTLKSHPVCLVSTDGLSFEMEKVLNNMPNSDGVKAGRILEINPDHSLFKTLVSLKADKEKISNYSTLLFDQGLLMAGFKIDDPNEFSIKLSQLMIEANK